MRCDVNWWCHQHAFRWTGVFYHDVAESKMAREMRCFTIEAAVLGREVGSARRQVRARLVLCPRYARSSPHCNGGLRFA